MVWLAPDQKDLVSIPDNFYGLDSFTYGDHGFFYKCLAVEGFKSSTSSPANSKKKKKGKDTNSPLNKAGFCYNYNTSRGCSSETCHRKHECSLCRDKHQ